jgi:hypothetical protein
LAGILGLPCASPSLALSSKCLARSDKSGGRIVEIELAECSYIEQAITAGVDVQYRPNASPLALLRLSPVHPAQPEPVLEAAE